MFYEEGNTTFYASWVIFSYSILTWYFESILFVKERLIKSYNVNWIFS